LCRTIYDLPSVSAAADFTTLEGGEDSYMGFNIDSGAAAPTYEGNCDGAAFAWGIGEMSEWVDGSQWGYGFGPMTSSWEDELAEALGDDWLSMGDTPGASYLKWESAEGVNVTTWGYFQVYGYGEGSLIDFESGPVEGVRDSSRPSDGYYYNNTMYVLSFSAG
jgi:hypothetical protein